MKTVRVMNMLFMGPPILFLEDFSPRSMRAEDSLILERDTVSLDE